MEAPIEINNNFNSYYINNKNKYDEFIFTSLTTVFGILLPILFNIRLNKFEALTLLNK